MIIDGLQTKIIEVIDVVAMVEGGKLDLESFWGRPYMLF